MRCFGALLLLPPALWLLTACAGGLRSDAAAPVTYVLRAPSGAAAAPAATGLPVTALAASLQVLRVVPRPGYESDRIVLLAPDRRLDVYAASRWPAPTPEVIAALAVDALRGTGRLRAVHDDAAPFAADYTLRLAIRRFDADYTVAGVDAPPQIHVVLDATLARRADRLVLASFSSESIGPAASNRMGSVVAAFDGALQSVLADLAARSTEAIAAELRTSTTPTPP